MKSLKAKRRKEKNGLEKNDEENKMSEHFEIKENTLFIDIDLYQDSLNEFTNKIDKLIETDAPEICVDLSRVNFISSSFIGKLAHLHHWLMNEKRYIKLIISPSMKETFDMCKFFDYMKIEVVE